MRRTFIRTALLLLAVGIAACNPRVDAPPLGVYRAVLRLPGGDAPFGLEVAQEQQKYVLYLINGAERTRVSNVQVADGELRAAFPGYENSLRATIHRKGLEGSVTLIKAGGKEQVIPFTATLGETHRFYPEAATDNADVAGTWEATFTNEKGETSKAILLLEQQHDRVTGSVMTPTGDHRFMDGQVHGDELQLSTFAGGLAYLYKLKVDAKGALQGDYWQGLASHEKVTAQRNEAATLDGAGKQTTLRDSSQRFAFTFRDVDGNPVSLSDERFRGKVVLVTLGGTWCPNCHDEARFPGAVLPRISRAGFRDRRVDVRAPRRLRKSCARRARLPHGSRHRVSDAHRRAVRDRRGQQGAADAQRHLRLSDCRSWSTATASCADIHTGFAGPATGRHHDEYVKEFREEVERLLAE